MQIWLQIALIAVHTKTAFVMEHPAPPSVPNAASIWAVEEVLKLQAIPGVAVRTILQGLYGAPSAKPTTLLSFNLPELDGTLMTWREPSGRPWTTLFGKLSTGAWATSVAKAYPEALNGALMDAFFRRAQRLHQCKAVQAKPLMPVGFAEAVEAIRASMRSSGFVMGLDFAH